MYMQDTDLVIFKILKKQLSSSIHFDFIALKGLSALLILTALRFPLSNLGSEYERLQTAPKPDKFSAINIWCTNI